MTGNFLLKFNLSDNFLFPCSRFDTVYQVPLSAEKNRGQLFENYFIKKSELNR